ncbi:hypothetical protein ES708_09553 [subsurface metagenome]
MTKHSLFSLALLFIAVLFITNVFAEDLPEGTAWVDRYGYTGCVELSNGSIRVVLEPNCGGRIMEYALNGQNVIYVDPEHDGYVYVPGGRRINPSGGRCDIGPEMLVPSRPALWLGKWKAEIIGPRTARMTSVEDASTGVQLIRTFQLAKDSSHLSYTQTIKNISGETKEYNHWSRTFAEGGGICLVPLTEKSRFPNGYIYYGPGSILNIRHEEHPNIRVRDGFLEVPGTPPQPKFGIDSYAGWFGYVTKSNLLFVKKFATYPNRVYGEVAAYTISLWYYKEQMCELEPIGPLEIIKPGASASFTEEWYLLPYDYPKSGEMVDLKEFTSFVEKNTN